MNPSPAAMRAAKAIYLRSEFDSNDIATIIDREFGPVARALREIVDLFDSGEPFAIFENMGEYHSTLAQLEAR